MNLINADVLITWLQERIDSCNAQEAEAKRMHNMATFDKARATSTLLELVKMEVERMVDAVEVVR